jgi:hypothetical protein
MRYCNPREPEVVAIATKLGEYEKTDYEFAQVAFEFVGGGVYFEMCP